LNSLNLPIDPHSQNIVLVHDVSPFCLSNLHYINIRRKYQTNKNFFIFYGPTPILSGFLFIRNHFS
jgi:hypothetical protein